MKDRKMRRKKKKDDYNRLLEMCQEYEIENQKLKEEKNAGKKKQNIEKRKKER